MPDPDKKWQQGLERSSGATDRVVAVPDIDYAGCQFADRCPDVMEECAVAPPLYPSSEARAVSCHLYKEGSTTAV